MKKLIVLLIVMSVLFAVFAADKSISGDNVIWVPGNVRAISFGNDGAAYDTLFAGGSNVYGPYRMNTSKNAPMYKAFQWYAKAATMDSVVDTTQFSYQIVAGSSIGDTSNIWTIVDSIRGITADTGTYTSIDSRAGNSIFFKLKNISSGDTTVLQKPIKLYFKEAAEVRYTK